MTFSPGSGCVWWGEAHGRDSWGNSVRHENLGPPLSVAYLFNVIPPFSTEEVKPFHLPSEETKAEVYSAASLCVSLRGFAKSDNLCTEHY